MVEQLNLFELEIENTEKSDAKYQVMDKVKIILIDEELDSETHHYRKYYEPHLIGKVGEITGISKKKSGHYTYEVDFYGTTAYFEEVELVWIG